MTSVTVPANVTFSKTYQGSGSGYRMFASCGALTEATVECAYVPPYMFESCKVLEKVTFTNSAVEFYCLNEGYEYNLQGHPFNNCTTKTIQIAGYDCSKAHYLASIDFNYISLEFTPVLNEDGTTAGDAHVLVDGVEVVPTETSTGLTAGQHCENCGLVTAAQKKTYLVSYSNIYDAESGTPDNQIKIQGEDLVLDSYKPVIENVEGLEGVTFLGWSITGNWDDGLLQPGDLYTANAGCVLQAVWQSSCGTNVNWVLMDDGVLRITGTGEMSNYGLSSGVPTAPWYEYADSITSIDIAEGVTSAGQYAFYGLTAVTTVSIPEGITSIGPSAFYGCSSIQNIHLPDTAVGLGQNAFRNCTALEEINIPYGVTQLSYGLFYGCSSLKAITIPESVKTIYNNSCEGVFYGCSSLTEVVIPDSVTKINGYGMFEGCTALQTVTLPNSLTAIPDHFCHGCRALTSIELPESITEIGYMAFISCSSLTSIDIPDSVTEIGSSTFVGCSSLNSVKLPANLTSIPGGLFNGCSSLSTIALPSGITEIGGGAFRGCTSLTTIELPNGVTSIGGYAFAEDTALTFISFPEHFTGIGEYVFKDCSALNLVVFSGTAPSFGSYCFSNVTATAYYPTGDDSWTEEIRQGYDGIITWSAYSKENRYVHYAAEPATCSAEGNIEYWYDSVMEKYYSDEVCATEITQSQTVLAKTEHNYGEDYVCTECGTIKVIASGTCGDTGCNINWVLNAQGLLTIVGTGSIADYELYDSDTTYTTAPWGSITYADQITAIRIEDGVTSIGEYAFYSLTALTSVTIPKSVTYIEKYAFGKCSALPAITLPDKLTDLEEGAFLACSSLTGITIPDGLKSIEKGTFTSCTNLSSVILPDSVTAIGSSAFTECTSLKKIDLPDTLTSLGSFAFAGCTKLESIVIPDGVKIIGKKTFNGCSNLASVAMSENLEVIDELAFANCTSLSFILMPGNAPWMIASDSFTNVKATIYYVKHDTTWTTSVLQNYGGTLTWTPVVDGKLHIVGMKAGDTVYADGTYYTANNNGAIEIPLDTQVVMTFTYTGTDNSDPHLQSPSGMKVYLISIEEDWSGQTPVATQIAALDDVFTCVGASIRTTGNQGMKIIYGIPSTTKASLIAGTLTGLEGYSLAEYGTVVTWADTSMNPYLGCSGAMSAYAYGNSGSYDDTSEDTNGDLQLYANALTFTNKERTKPDLAIRPYMILNTPNGEQITIYGGVIIRNIGYVAWQCRDEGQSGDPSYEFIHEIIDYVYPNGYTE